jgi:site-specific DNA-methyltransferase (adenine-specific)
VTNSLHDLVRFSDSAVTLYRGNCLELLPALADQPVDAVITDPPYSSGGQYRGDRMQSTSAKYVQSGQVLQQGDFSGDNRDQRAYGHWCALWLAECLRVTKPGGVCCLFTDWRQLPTTTDALQAGGLEVIANKPNTAQEKHNDTTNSESKG